MSHSSTLVQTICIFLLEGFHNCGEEDKPCKFFTILQQSKKSQMFHWQLQKYQNGNP